MSTIIYRNTHTANVKIAYEDDPTFLSFRAAVWQVCELNKELKISNAKLYSLWYISNTFHTYWKEQPSKKVSNNMIFILGHNFLTEIEGRMVMFVWIKKHYPHLSTEKWREWEEKMFYPTWERIQTSIQRARDRKNARRREKRKMMKRGRPQQTTDDCLRKRILAALAEHPSTNAGLAKRLDVNPKTVHTALSRMVVTHEIVKIERGLYAMPGSQQIEITLDRREKEISAIA